MESTWWANIGVSVGIICYAVSKESKTSSNICTNVFTRGYLYLNVVSSLWLEYPLELRTCRFMRADAFADFLVGYDGLCLRERFEGEFSEDDDVSSTVSAWEVKNNVRNFYAEPFSRYH